MSASDYNRARDTIAASKGKIGYARLDSATDVSKVSVIGSGMRSHAGVAAKAFKALSERNINIRAITTSEIKFSVLIDAAYTELAVRTLHTLYGLDQLRTFSVKSSAWSVAKRAFRQTMHFAGAASALNTLIVLAGVLLGKTSLDCYTACEWVPQLRHGLATRFGRDISACGRAE